MVFESIRFIMTTRKITNMADNCYAFVRIIINYAELQTVFCMYIYIVLWSNFAEVSFVGRSLVLPGFDLILFLFIEHLVPVRRLTCVQRSSSMLPDCACLCYIQSVA